MNENEAFKKAKENIEKRFGVTFNEYMNIPRTQDVQTKINRALKKETMRQRLSSI